MGQQEGAVDPIEFVLKWEGGYKNDSSDPGGETNWGISKRAYPNLDIKALTREGAIYLYRKDYWEMIGADSMPPHLALVAMNAAVNCGVSRANSWVDQCGGDYREFIRLQLAHYASLKNRLYLQGWLNRTLDAWREAKRMLKATSGNP